MNKANKMFIILGIMLVIGMSTVLGFSSGLFQNSKGSSEHGETLQVFSLMIPILLLIIAIAIFHKKKTKQTTILLFCVFLYAIICLLQLVLKTYLTVEIIGIIEIVKWALLGIAALFGIIEGIYYIRNMKVG